MTNRIAAISLRQAAKIAGFARLISIIPAIFANFFVLQSFIVPGDAATTANNVMANELLFRMSIGSWPIVFALDLVMAWALYVLLKPVNRSLSLLAAWFSLIHVAIAGSALANHLSVLQLLSGADYLTVFGTGQLHAQVMQFFNAYDNGFHIGLFFFGFHLLILGYLVYKSGYIPRIISILLIAASLGYLIDSVGNLFLPNYPEIIGQILIVPNFIGELAIIVWLVWKGGKGTTADDHALESA